MFTTTFLLPLPELKGLTPHQIRTTYGGKALGLFEAHEIGVAIPQTWLIGVDHFDAPLTNDLTAHLESLPDTLFAVRSSAVGEDAQEHSFAGIFESRLNVPKKELIKAIQSVWASGHTLRAFEYAGSFAGLKMGVIIQEMVQAQMAGVLFSKHPSPENVFENHDVVVEFAPTSGDKVVGGQITPWRLEGNEESLSQSVDFPWLLTLLQAQIELKNRHRGEVDVEFVVNEKGECIVVQQRPISRAAPSHLLDLSEYIRKYKRTLFALDIEMLIEGCATHLSSTLELPYRLERWMVMTSNPDRSRELWVHRLLDGAVITHLGTRLAHDHPFLEKIEKRYQMTFEKIVGNDSAPLVDRGVPLQNRFASWCEWMAPLHAHYYVPVFMIDALHVALLHEWKKIDPQQGEEDLFFLGTFGIATLMDKLYDELESGVLPLEEIHRRFGFLKCRAVTEEGYTKQELEAMRGHKRSKGDEKDEKKWHHLFAKYVTSPGVSVLFEKFREWMRIRNQEMEYLMFAILQSRPLFIEISEKLGCSLEEVWNTPSQRLLKALQKNEKIPGLPLVSEKLVIYHSFGKTRTSDALAIVGKGGIKRKELQGKRVFGKGKVRGRVHIAYDAASLAGKTFEEPTILVTGMTTPDFIPHLKHFAALITDEGGILCHAAIVARESALPCLVGTLHATELFEDGMMIEIDFETSGVSRC